MKNGKKYHTAVAVADEIYNHLSRVGVTCYETPTCNRVLWVPWCKSVIDLNNPKAIGHALVMTGRMEAKVSMRATVVDEFISICRETAQAIRRAPDDVQLKVREMRLY